jgi:S-DNA-T family DNA segregation ATPase FtsK/SpoIIIE
MPAERALFLFGLAAVLFVPMLYAFARKLWRDAEREETPHGRRWWRTSACCCWRWRCSAPR